MIILQRYPTTIIELEQAEQDEFIAKGNARTASNRGLGVQHRADSAKYAYATNDPIGFVGEGTAGWHYQLRVDDTLGEYDNVDLEIMEVRSTGRATGELAIKEPDIQKKKLHLPFLLARVNLTKRRVEFVGWLTGWQALERPVNDPQRGIIGKRYYADQQTWYVPPPYNTIRSLEDWRWCRHPRLPPPLWMPWDFDPRHPNTNRQFPFYAEEL